MADDLFSDIPAAEQADALFADLPKDKRRAGVRAALLDILSNRVRGSNPNVTRNLRYGASDRAAEAYTLGLTGLSNAGIGAAITGLQRAVPGGKSPTYTARDYFDATRLYDDAQRRAYAAKKPVRAAIADIGGALAMPGSEALGRFVIGKAAPRIAATGAKVPLATRAAQTGRAALAGGALSGAQAGALAPPGQEAERARSAAVTGAIAAPVMGGVAAVVPGAARAVARTAKRAVGRGPSAEITSIEKLQNALRDAGATPDMIEAASTEWAQMGGVTPATIDLLKDAGATPEVLRLLSRSTGRAPQRKIAEAYAEEVVGGTQAAALEQARKLPTGGETRTPAQIRADLDVERARIAAEQEGASRAAPEAPRARETGAAAFADELNKLYDVSEKSYKEAYAAAEAAKPEAALVDDTEVRPLFDKLRAAMRGMNPDLEGVSAVSRYIEKVKGEIAPGEVADWPEGEVMELAKPLSVQQLEFIRQKMVELAEKHGGATGGAAASKVKAVVDDELARLAAEKKITGDPDVVDKWTQAIVGRAEHGRKFGSGTAAKLTARKPSGEREVESFRAGDVIFGTPSQASVNKALGELGDTLSLVSPEARRALQEELYGRIKVEDIPKLRETTGGKLLLPEDLTAEALAAQQATQAAEESAAAQVQGLEAGPQAALELGESVLKRPSEEFEPAIGAVASQDLPIAASGARQAVLDVLERTSPESTGPMGGLLSARASKNLRLAVTPQDVAAMQARLRAISKRGQTAQELERAVGSSAVHTDPLIETVTPSELAYRSGRFEGVLRLLRSGRYLNEKEYAAALKTLTSKDPAAKARLLDGLIKKYPGVKRAISPALARPAAGEGDETAVETLEEEYGVTP